MMPDEQPKQWSPPALGATTLQNRIVMTARTTGYGWGDPRDDGDRQFAGWAPDLALPQSLSLAW